MEFAIATLLGDFCDSHLWIIGKKICEGFKWYVIQKNKSTRNSWWKNSWKIDQYPESLRVEHHHFRPTRQTNLSSGTAGAVLPYFTAQWAIGGAQRWAKGGGVLPLAIVVPLTSWQLAAEVKAAVSQTRLFLASAQSPECQLLVWKKPEVRVHISGLCLLMIFKRPEPSQRYPTGMSNQFPKKNAFATGIYLLKTEL